MDGGGPKLTRKDAAQSAGRSERQMKTANRVASIPADQFTGLVESDNPPTVTKLAEMGTQGVRGAVRCVRHEIGAVRQSPLNDCRTVAVQMKKATRKMA